MEKYFLPYKYCLKLKNIGYNYESIAYYSNDGYENIHFIDTVDLISNDNMNKPSMYGTYCIAILWVDFFKYCKVELGVFNDREKLSNESLEFIIKQLENKK